MVEPKARFRPEQRLRASRQFEEIYGRGARVHTTTLVLYGRWNLLGHHRLGVTVSRKIGGSVVRNRVKRRIREIFRTQLPAAGLGIDMVVNAKRPIVVAPFLQIQKELLDAVYRISGMLSRTPPEPPDGSLPARMR